MNELFEKHRWLRAFNLEERSQAVIEWEHYPVNESMRELCESWKTNPNFTNTLSCLALSENQFKQIFLEQVCLDFARLDFSWLDFLERSFKTSDDDASQLASEWCDLTLSSAGLNIESFGLEVICYPLFRYQLIKLCHAMQVYNKSEQLQLTTLISTSAETIKEKLREICAKAMVVEMHQQKKQGLLVGETPTERYRFFVKQFKTNKQRCLQFLVKYPVLARQAARALMQWFEATLELLARFDKDCLELDAQFGPLGALESIAFGGDKHNHGRSVATLKFVTGKHLLYKPRSLAIDAAYNNLLVRIYQGSDLYLQTPKLIVKENYGWVEHIEYRPCESESEVEEFFHRAGALLALATIFQISDLHFENLIASGSHPIIIDLETFLHPRYEGVESEALSPDLDDSIFLLKTGLLPSQKYAEKIEAAFDTSGLGGIGGQETDVSSLGWIDENTDAMRMAVVPAGTGQKQNLCRIGDKFINPLNHLNTIKAGFSTVYRLFEQHQDLARLDDGLPTIQRCLLLHSFSYARVLVGLYYPERQKNAIVADLHLMQLWRLDSNRCLLPMEVRERVIPREVRAMHEGNIPLFLCDVRHGTLSDCDGEFASMKIQNVLDDIGHRVSRFNTETKLPQLLDTIDQAFEQFQNNSRLQALFQREKFTKKNVS